MIDIDSGPLYISVLDQLRPILPFFFSSRGEREDSDRHDLACSLLSVGAEDWT